MLRFATPLFVVALAAAACADQPPHTPAALTPPIQAPLPPTPSLIRAGVTEHLTTTRIPRKCCAKYTGLCP